MTAVSPKLIVLDEPASALDFSKLILNALRELGGCPPLIGHSIVVVQYFVDFVAVLNRGRAEENGPVATVPRNSALSAR